MSVLDEVPAATPPGWAVPLLQQLGLEPGAPAAEVYERANALASRLAPNTRRLWRSILLLEGLAVLLPLLWLMVEQREWSAAVVAASVALCTIAVVGFCWWLRWKRQQHVWSRSRLFAEIARSQIATASWPGHPTRDALFPSPSLQPIADLFSAKTDAAGDFETRRDAYIRHRIDDQTAFFEHSSRKAAEERRRLSLYVTRSLDGSLVLAVLGLWLGFSGTADWLLSVANSDLILGLVGAALPLTAILMQSLSSYLELNRRAGRFAQQWEFLKVSRARLAASSPEEAAGHVKDIETALLSEVTEWFYQSEHSESFYRTGTAAQSAARDRLTTTNESWGAHLAGRLLHASGIALGFTGRIVFGRVLIVAITSVLTSLLIISRAPRDAVQSTLLRTADGQLLSSAGPLGWWQPKKEETERGFVLIAHGLHDSAKIDPEEKSKSGAASDLHWMTKLQQTIRSNFSDATPPDVCLVDWSLAAKPSETTQLLQRVAAEVGKNDTAVFVADVTAIRSQAQAIGDVVGYKLAQAIRANPPVIHREKPMHLIGHSAGGFLVVRAACVLKGLGLLPEHTRVTLLDTPLPDIDNLQILLRDGYCSVDYYKSSIFAQNVPADHSLPRYRCFTLTPDAAHASPATAAHSYAHQWYIRSADPGAKSRTDQAPGFRLSPFSGGY